MKLLLIDNYDSFTYNLVALLQQIPDVDLTIMHNDDALLLQPIAHSHIIISPGPDLPNAAGNLLQCLRNNYLQKSILGICLGHQALAEILGCSLYQLAVPQHGLLSEICVESNTKLFKNIASPFVIGLYHSWAIAPQSVPSNVCITALDSNKIIMAFEHKTLPLFGVQFHPESYMTQNGLQIIKNFLQLP